ncbi:MAG TPA: hypothetical protein VFK48_15925 [Usitatibacter sp.]|nr:hypothetical protein [Usitatibacter sp.]
MNPSVRSLLSIALLAVPCAAGAQGLISYCYRGSYCIRSPSVIEFRPAGLGFGAQRIGTASSQTATLVNISTRDARLLTPWFEPSPYLPGAKGGYSLASTCPVFPAVLPAGASCSVTVTFAPSQAGPHDSVVFFVEELNLVGYYHAARYYLGLSGTGVTSYAPENATGLWSVPQEQGWGVSFAQQGDTLFSSIFTYGPDGAPVWLFASGLARQADGAFAGDLFRAPSGPPFFQKAWPPVALVREGAMRVKFEDDGSATLDYNVGAIGIGKRLEPHRFGPRETRCTPGPLERTALINYQDLWWNAAEPGWGLDIAHEGDMLFATLFTYDAGGRNTWYFAPEMPLQRDGTYAGWLHAATGPWFGAAQPGPARPREVGRMTLRFADGEHGRLAYTIDGRLVEKDITRYAFGASAGWCR